MTLESDVEEQLGEAGEAEETVETTIPIPEEAKIAELTAHCRKQSSWPEGWTKMKAGFIFLR